MENCQCMCRNQNMEKSKETQLAYEIATALNDLPSIDWHIAICKTYSETLLREKLQVALTRPGIGNRAAYYNTLIKRHGQHSRN